MSREVKCQIYLAEVSLVVLSRRARPEVKSHREVMKTPLPGVLEVDATRACTWLIKARHTETT